MYPGEIKNRALIAAYCAEINGFFATAEALRQIANVCSEEAKVLGSAMGDLRQVANEIQP
jgi:hypothetical protein